MLDSRKLDRLAAELHASSANQLEFVNGGYYLPVQLIRRTLELMAAAGVCSIVPVTDREQETTEPRRAKAGEQRAAS